MGTVTAPSTAPPTPARPADAAAARLAGRITWWSLAAFVGLRALVVLVADTPTVTPDELGSWAVAKVLVGAEPMSMQGTPRYSLLSGAVIAPVQALGLGGAAAYRVALVVLAALLVATAAVLRRAVELIRPGRPVLAACAWALALLFPATLTTASFTWAEPVVTLWWALLAWGVAAVLVTDRPRATVPASVVAGAAVAVHGRFLLVPVIWVLALAADAVLSRSRRDGVLSRSRRDGVLSRSRRDGGPAGPGASAHAGRGSRGRADLAGIAVTVLTAAALSALDHLVAGRVWRGQVVDVELGPEPTSIDWWNGALTAVAGRLWYAVAATAGLAVLGALGLWVTASRPGPSRARLGAATLAALLGSNLAIAAVQGAGLASDLGWHGPFGGLRWDHLVYGRYIDGALLVLAVVGLVAATELVGRRAGTVTLAAGGAAMAASAVVVAVRSRDADLWPSIDVMMGGTSWLPFGTDRLALTAWTLVAVAVLAAGAVALRRSWQAFALVLALWFGAGALLGTVETAQSHRRHAQPDLVAPLGAAPRDGAVAAVAQDVRELPEWLLGVYAQERDLVDHGWSVELEARGSEDLARSRSGAGSSTSGTAALVLVDGVEPAGGGWDPVAEFRGAVVWRRQAAAGRTGD